MQLLEYEQTLFWIHSDLKSIVLENKANIHGIDTLYRVSQKST